VSKKIAAILGLIVIIVFLAYDSSRHFSEDVVRSKRQANSGQNNWNMFYGQRFVYYDSAFRYLADFDEISAIIEPNQVILSDLATSYYAAASLPVYVRNVQIHHGRRQSRLWNQALEDRIFCNLHLEDSAEVFKALIAEEVAKPNGIPRLRYILVNNDKNNKNVRVDCLWNRRALLIEHIDDITQLIFKGQYLSLYELKSL